MSRRHHEETSFGSDSFLDVIANIVGILIILIVVAGVRVSQAPLNRKSAEQHIEAPTLPEENLVELLPVEENEDDFPLLAELYQESPVVAEPVRPEPAVADFIPPPLQTYPKIDPVTLDQKLVEQVQQYQEMKKTLADELLELESALKEKLPAQQKQVETFQSEVQNLNASNEKLQALLQLIEISRSENLRSQQVVDQLLDKKKQTAELEPEAETLAHKLNPVGKLVDGKEVHFMLSGNKIAFVPVQHLAELVKRDMQKRSDFLFKQRRFQSRVGPVNGFEMEYLVQREGGGLLNESGYGSGRIRISLTDWVLRPSGMVFSETLDEAIVPDSQFRTALISEGTNATITFWVYPDSFELHQQLKKMVHDSGFWVASRPLPFGYPIAGSSTNGSKSIAQ